MLKISEISKVAPNDERSKLETRVYQELEKLGIPFERVDNDSVEAMEECIAIGEKLGAEIRKSVFVCDRKKINFYLVIMPANKHFNTKVFCDKMGCSRVSFAPAECMQEYLGVLPGTASVMSLLNDGNKKVKLVMDKEVAESEWFACNPGANTTHIKIKTDHILNRFLPYIDHMAAIVAL
ncbi:MAG: prolyl-tRNA synthetase associated domain-containing protein [bacterium]|nr:prolyl-tRNA synthetase associated domain-containing protein [bacterium]